MKLLLSVAVVLLLPLPLVTLLQTGGQGQWLQQPWWATYGPTYLFGVSVALVGLLLLFWLVVLLWPRQQTLYFNQQTSGQLRVTKKAIEQFTLAAVQAEPYIRQPKVTAKLTRNKLKVQIKGDLRTSENVAQQAAVFGQQLERDLRHLLGISAEKQVIVKLQQFSKQRQQQARVV